MRHLPRSRRLTGDAGTTLAEILVVTALSTLVLGLVFGMVMFGGSQSRGVNARLDDTQAARIAMDTVSRTLRAAEAPDVSTPVFTVTGPRMLTFYSGVNTQVSPTVNDFAGPSRYEYWVDGTGQLFESRTAAAGTTPPYSYTGTPVVRVLATHVQGSGPIFTYLGQADTTTSSLAVNGSGNLTPEAANSVYAVEMALRLNSSTTPAIADTEALERVTVHSRYAATVNGRGNCPTTSPTPGGISWTDCSGNG